MSAAGPTQTQSADGTGRESENKCTNQKKKEKERKSIMFDVTVSQWQRMLMEEGNPVKMTLWAACNVISAMCEYEISNGFRHIRAVFISSIYSPLVSNAIC